MNARKVTTILIISSLMGGMAASADAEIKLGQERFAGRGTRGPYSIAWQSIEDRTEQVWVNGRLMARGQDYLFDATLGAISFSEPVRSSDSIQINYQYDTAKAHAPTGISGTMGLLSNNTGGLSLSYGFKSNSAGSQTLSNLGFSGQSSLAGGTLSSTYMVDKTAGSAAGSDAQNVSLKMSRDTGKFTYSVDYAQVGQKFSQADALKLVKGSKALSFNGSLQLAQNSALTLKQSNTTTPDAKTGVAKDTTTQSGSLGLNLSANTKLTALHETQATTQGTATTNSAVDRVQVDQQLGKQATATLLNETVTSGKNGDSETVQATRMNLAATGNAGLKLQTTLAMSDSSKTGAARDATMNVSRGDGNTKVALALTDHQGDNGDKQTHTLSLETKRNDGLSIAAGLQGEKTDNGAHDKATLAMKGGTTDRLRFAMGVSNDSGVGKQGVGTSVSLSSAMAKTLQFSASRTDDKTVENGASTTKMNLSTEAGVVKVAMSYDGNDDGSVNKTKSGVNVEAAPISALKLTASHNNSTDASGLSGANSVGITAGTTAAKLTGSYTDSLTPTGASSIREATLNLVPLKNRMTLSGGYRNELNKDDTQVQIAMLQAEIKPVTALALSGSYKQRDTGAADEINTTNASVTLKPVSALQLIGTYAANPEEKNEVLRLVRKGLAVQTKVGGLSLTGGYTQEDSLVDDSEGTRAEFKLGLRFNKHANLEGGYSQTVGAVRGYAPQLAYNVKYNHELGSDFHLLLDADVVQKDDSVPAAQRNVVKATANFGLRF